MLCMLVLDHVAELLIVSCLRGQQVNLMCRVQSSDQVHATQA